MTRTALFLSCALAFCLASPAMAQDLSDRPVAPPAPLADPLPADPDQIQFAADTLDYDSDTDIVAASGNVNLSRQSDRLRADKVIWNRKTGQVTANGNIVVTNPQGDVAYGDSIVLTDTLRDGMIENMLVVLDEGGRIAADHGERSEGGSITVEQAAYTPCDVTSSEGCPKEPSWKITAKKIVYNPDRKRIRFTGARISVFGISTPPLPPFSTPIGGDGSPGLLTPEARYDRVNGFELALPYYFDLGRNRDLTITPHLFTGALPMIEGHYRALNEHGAYQARAYGTYSRQRDDRLGSASAASSQNDFRGYVEANGRFQLDPNWSITGQLRLASDDTFLRRYDISREDRLRNFIEAERIDRDSYLSISGWAVQSLRTGDSQGSQPIALPEVDYRRRINDALLGGTINLQLNSLALTRTDGQDTQRAFASAKWDLRRLTPWGQEVTLTAFARADAYNTDDALDTIVASYRGEEGFRTRAIGALAVDVKWPLVGALFGGTQRVTPRFQIVAAPPIANLEVPNEDARAVDLEDSNLFSLNRFPGYDRFEDSTRFTYGVDYALALPGLSVLANIGQSYRLTSRASILPDGTGLSERVSDVVGRTEVRWRDFVSVVHRYRLDKDSLAVRRNEIDATIGSRQTYVLLGYLRLDRNIAPSIEDLQDREEARAGARVKVSRFWSVFGSATIDLTDRNEDVLSVADGFDPVRHRLGFAYEDNCLKLGLTWRRDYEDTGDARRGNSFLLTLQLKNLGR